VDHGVVVAQLAGAAVVAGLGGWGGGGLELGFEQVGGGVNRLGGELWGVGG
jgi:hypothetical protein